MHCLILVSEHGWCWCQSCGLAVRCSASLATPQADVFGSSHTTFTSAVNRCTNFFRLWRSLIRSLLQNHPPCAACSILVYLAMTCSFWKPVSHSFQVLWLCHFAAAFVANPIYTCGSSVYCAVISHGLLHRPDLLQCTFCWCCTCAWLGLHSV